MGNWGYNNGTMRALQVVLVQLMRLNNSSGAITLLCL